MEPWSLSMYTLHTSLGVPFETRGSCALCRYSRSQSMAIQFSFYGSRPFFYTYDLQQGTSTLHRRVSDDQGSTTHLFFHPRRLLATRNGDEDTSSTGGEGGDGNTKDILHTRLSPIYH
ncbi:hypothetical protein BDZ97DRAFT_135302 [Flammula alnicola]|nr:hypothetical protein BDZ97DRAFT_135302 [Flammula alnicola]